MNTQKHEFCSKFTLMIDKYIYPRSLWTSKEWLEKKMFDCDWCYRRVFGYRISRPIARERSDVTKVEKCYCSLTCCNEATLCLRDINLAEVLFHQTRMFRNVYGVFDPIPPAKYHPSRMSKF